MEADNRAQMLLEDSAGKLSDRAPPEISSDLTLQHQHRLTSHKTRPQPFHILRLPYVLQNLHATTSIKGETRYEGTRQSKNLKNQLQEE